MTFLLLLLLLAQFPSEHSSGGALASGPCCLQPCGRAQGQGGAAQEDTDAGLGCFSLGWHRVLLGWNIICRAAQEGSGTQGKQRHLTSPRSLALGLASLCLPSACCRNPRLSGLRGKERHLEVTLGEQIHALSTCDPALCISLKRLGCASAGCRAGGQGVPPPQDLALLDATGRELLLVVLQAPVFGGGARLRPQLLVVLSWPE